MKQSESFRDMTEFEINTMVSVLEMIKKGCKNEPYCSACILDSTICGIYPSSYDLEELKEIISEKMGEEENEQ